jgi:hypothetical protein
MNLSSADKDLAVRAGLTIGGGVAVYFLVLKPLLEKLGLKQTADEKAQEKVQKQGREKFIDDAIKKPNPKQTKGGKPTRPEGQFAVWADQIYEYLKYTKLDDKKDLAFALLFKYFHNDADIALLTKYFGKRQEYAFGLPVGNPKNLSEFVTTNLSKEQINRLNNAYLKSKMKFRF